MVLGTMDAELLDVYKLFGAVSALMDFLFLVHLLVVVQTTLSSEGFSLDNIKLEAIADEFIKDDEDMKEID